MVTGFLGRLTSQAIRGLARNLFPGFYERGITANRALKELQELGLGYRRADFLRDFRVGAERYEDTIRIRFVNRDKTPSEGILDSLYHGVPDRYSFVYRVRGLDLETNEEGERYFFHHRGTLATRGEMEDEARSWFVNQADKYPFLVDSISITEGYINPIWA